MMKPYDTDVIIVGAGPVGLTLACELRLAGVHVTVLERRDERGEQSRALTIHGRTLEMLELRGLAARFVSLGMPIPKGHFAGLDTRLDFSVFDTRFPFTLFLPQTSTERLLEEHAIAAGAVIRRGALVQQTGQTEDGASVSGTLGGHPFQLGARYLVGADGARSSVREQADIAFPGAAASKTMMLGDVSLAHPPATPVISASNAAGGIMIAPLGQGRFRVVAVDAGRHGVPQSEPVTLQELASAAEAITGVDYGLHAPSWLSRFSDETRLASSYRQGRMFLAGDAAHIHPPAGGQGMNVGMQDAMNLGWKLAGVVNGYAPDSLLDSYHRERHPVGAALYRNTMAQTAMMTAFDPRTLALRDMMSELLALPELNRKLAGDLSGFAIHYPAPLAISRADAAAWLSPEWSGRRVPDWPITLADGKPSSLHAQLRDGKWLLLQIGNGADPAEKFPFAPAWLRSVRVAVDGAAAELAGIEALLIRPDGYADFAVSRQHSHA
jgi:2-polyprenyl-6-methoxyphenol hydroxylase-like FAD-dependent oxidoreductase